MQLAQCPPVVGDMFEQVVAENDIDRTVGQRDLLHVEVQVGQRAFEVGRDILPGEAGEMRLQVAHDADLGGDVQRPGVALQQVGLAREVEPQQTVALQREAVRTEGVGA